MNWETMGQIVSVAGLCATAFHFAVLRPLNEAIVRLDATLQKFETQLQKMEANHHLLELELTKVKQQATAAHQRLDELMRFIKFDWMSHKQDDDE